MSVATEFATTVSIPARAPAVGQRQTLASVSVLHPPADPAPVSWRLTRRGVLVVTAAVVAFGAGLIWLARLSAPQPVSAPAAPHAVTVQPGDTLWAIATRVAPAADPRAEVAALQQRNGLTGVDLFPGQVLVVP